MIHGAIFDFDGTLFDSMGVWQALPKRYLEAQGVHPPDNVFDEIRSMTFPQAAEYFIREYALPKDVHQVLQETSAIIMEMYAREVMPKPGVQELLDCLADHGVSMCIATATDRPMIEAALKRCGLDHYFSAIFTCTEVQKSKTDPEIYELARRHLGTVKSETLVAEDALHAAKTAKEAGFVLLGVSDPSEPGQKELRRISDLYAERLDLPCVMEQVKELLQRPDFSLPPDG